MLSANKELAKENIQDENIESEEKVKSSGSQISITYEPLSFDTYKFFMKFAPVLEKTITNNIEKHLLQSSQNEKIELKQFHKVKDFILPEELIKELNVNNMPNHRVSFNGKIIYK